MLTKKQVDQIANKTIADLSNRQSFESLKTPNNYDKTSARRQNKRVAALNQIAIGLGFSSWSKLETKVMNGEVKVIIIMSEQSSGTPAA